MVKVLSMIVGLLVLSIGGLGGLLWTAGNQSIDPQTEAGKNYAQSFKSTINGSCKRLVNSQLGPLAKDEEVQDTVRDICKCAADMSYNNFKDQPPIKLASLVLDPKAHAKIKKITQECLDRADIPRPEEFEEADWQDDS